MRPARWRVRVKRSIETYVDVQATDANGAENEALKVPGVMSVFPKSAMLVEEAERVERQQFPGVEE